MKTKLMRVNENFFNFQIADSIGEALGNQGIKYEAGNYVGYITILSKYMIPVKSTSRYQPGRVSDEDSVISC
jgi:hypothetical protein